MRLEADVENMQQAVTAAAAAIQRAETSISRIEVTIATMVASVSGARWAAAALFATAMAVGGLVAKAIPLLWGAK